MSPVYLLIGVPCSGKTWVADALQKANSWLWVEHDAYHVEDYWKAVWYAAGAAGTPVIAEAPFRASVLKEQLEKKGVKVVECYITAPEALLEQRYEARKGLAYPKAFRTNLAKYNARYKDLTIRGTSSEVLQLLKERSNAK